MIILNVFIVNFVLVSVHNTSVIYFHEYLIDWKRACVLWHGDVFEMYSALLHQELHCYVMPSINSSVGAVPGNSEPLQCCKIYKQ